MVLGLMYACKMHKVLARGGPERRKIRKRLVKIIRDNEFASGIKKVIMEMHSAITAGVATKPAIAADTTATSASN